jgi:cell division protein FtsW
MIGSQSGSKSVIVLSNQPVNVPKLKKDWLPVNLADGITLVAMTLLALGIVMVYSSSSIRMELKASDATVYLRRQILWAVLASIVFLIARSTNVDVLRRLATPIYVSCCLLLVAVLIPGVSRSRGGALRWLSFGGMNIQPSEIAKVAMIILLAKCIDLRRHKLHSFKTGFLPIIAPVLIVGGLVIVEPDFGSAGLLVGVGMIMIFVAGARIKHLTVLAIPGLLALAALIMLKGAHVRERLAAFFDPNADPNGVSYQGLQAIIALGSGGFWGQGLGASRQKRLFLPDAHTDFIFALVGEELGFVGACGLVMLFALLLFFGFVAVMRAKDRFSFFLSFGLTLFLGFQAIINMAVATGTIPPKGIALPLISFGGSSLCICAASLGILVNIAMSGQRAPGPSDQHSNPRDPSLIKTSELACHD